MPRTLSLHDRLTARACLPASSFAPKGITTLTQHDGTEKAKTFASKYTLNQFILDLAEVTETDLPCRIATTRNRKFT